MKKLLILIPMFALIAVLGCQTYSPVIDPGSVQSGDRYYRDQAECRAIAKQGAPGWKDTAKDTAIGGGVGAGTGALIGAIAGDAVKGLAFGAVIGGVAGGAKGIYDSEKGYEQIYRNCMTGRGYNVLN
ncbi:MAG: YMGG-like glycine zipper-containing protein [Thermodesulfobacteriota bacterium]|nr:glycine zipper domain-containing protein [Candidatus Dadabacteria bacterium]